MPGRVGFYQFLAVLPYIRSPNRQLSLAQSLNTSDWDLVFPRSSTLSVWGNLMKNPFVHSEKGRHQRGSVLVEFSLIAVVLSLFITFVIDVSRMVFISQVLQESARVATREFSLLPLPPAMTFEQALNHPQVRKHIFDPSALVINMEEFEDDHLREEFFNQLPILNLMLRPLMTPDRLIVEGRTIDVLRFPGVVLQEGQGGAHSPFKIGVPHRMAASMSEPESLVWKSVVEEVKLSPKDSDSGLFSLHVTQDQGKPSGFVALRINYPFRPLFVNWLPQIRIAEFYRAVVG